MRPKVLTYSHSFIVISTAGFWPNPAPLVELLNGSYRDIAW